LLTIAPAVGDPGRLQLEVRAASHVVEDEKTEHVEMTAAAGAAMEVGAVGGTVVHSAAPIVAQHAAGVAVTLEQAFWEA